MLHGGGGQVSSRFDLVGCGFLGEETKLDTNMIALGKKIFRDPSETAKATSMAGKVGSRVVYVDRLKDLTLASAALRGPVEMGVDVIPSTFAGRH